MTLHYILNNKNIKVGGHSIIMFSLMGGGWVRQNANIWEQGEVLCLINANVRIYIYFLIKHLVLKLLTIVTRFPVLLKISVLKKLYRANNHKSMTFAWNNQFKVIQSPYSS